MRVHPAIHDPPKSAPVMNDDAGEARNATTFAASAGFPRRARSRRLTFPPEGRDDGPTSTRCRHTSASLVDLFD